MRRAPGFSLIELVLVIVLIGLMATVSASLISQPFRVSADIQRRARMADDADQAMSRISRDLRLALPNSLRTSADGSAIEMLRGVAGAPYRDQIDASGGGDPLDFAVADSSFDLLLPFRVTPEPGQWVVIYNLSASAPQANAWFGDNRATVGTGSSVDRIVLTPAFRFPYPSPQQRAYLVDEAVQFRCAGGELRRESGYAPAASLSSPPTGASSVLLADGIAACSFRYDPGASSRHALVTLQLGLNRDGEQFSLQKSVHLPNAP